ncbi:hypothetical protein [Pseudomonas sp. zfem002]|uniref:hypothetical protein n=1 Tax=Pseudomonas sp. zfem002 TaxID=3078197 RepID=UPI00292812C3|nr:hypothetical protein [Pseudomonas sp. zfem002]MDU9389665.1 hypothetical protein [Pseudomonas sp. zfem002]
MRNLLTPGALLALVEDNVRHYELLMSGHESSLLDLWHRHTLVAQSIVAELRGQPGARLRHPELEVEVRHAVAQRQGQVAKAQQVLDEIERDIGQLIGELRLLVAQRERQMTQLWRDHLARPELANWLREHDLLAAEHARLSESLARLARERDEKMPAYEGNPFYVHLRSRRYATGDYARSGLFRRLDDWLANKTNYRENRRNELILRSMPDAVSDLINQCASKAQAIEQSSSTVWLTSLKPLREGPDALRLSLLVKQIIAAKVRANTAYEVVESFSHEEDEWSANANQWLDEQIAEEDLYTVLEKLIERHPDDREAYDRHWEALTAVIEEGEALNQRIEQAAQDYKHAKELEWALRDLRSSEGACGESCTCACHTSGDTFNGQCPCLYNDERYYTYPATMDCRGLISAYMKRNLSAEDLVELFDNQRQAFADTMTPTPAASAARSAPPITDESLSS